MKKNPLSRFAILLLLVVMSYTTISLQQWKSLNKVIEDDVISYYEYLPALFIHNDISLEFTRDTSKHFEQNHQFWYQSTENGNRIIKTTSGLAVLYSPFFFVAHLYSLSSDYPANGFSVPYQFCLIISSLFYLFVGLFFLRKLLLFFYSDLIVSIVLICILLGTNLFYYTTSEPAMSHCYSFCLITIFVFYFIKSYDNPSIKYSIIMGCLLGLIFLIRPINILILLFAFFYRVNSKSAFIKQCLYFIHNKKHIIIMITIVFFIFLPQMIYWKLMTNHWFYNSYQNEQFYFKNPHIVQGLFGFRKGWLIYTPIMIFAALGILGLRKSNNHFFYSLIIFTLINFYVQFSWWAWNYGGGYSARTLIDCYTILAIPFCEFLKFTFMKKKYFVILISIVLLLFISLNQFQTMQKRKAILHWDGMNSNVYKLIFLKSELTADEWKLYDKWIDKHDAQKQLQGLED